jgi:hypothetical protein
MAMGHLELFAQHTFAEETERITAGGAGWLDPPEIRLQKVQSDGLLVIREPHLLKHLAPPWPEAQAHSEVMLELKLAGNHLDRKATERALLRRQARQIQRLEEGDDTWLGDEPLWLVASHVPGWLKQKYDPMRFAEGCYLVEQRFRSFVWIAANDLPLRDDLIPFLMARSGRLLDDFGRWVASQRPLEWVMNMLKYLPMSVPSRQELLQKFGPVDDPEIEERRQEILKALLASSPKARQELIDEGRVEGRLEGELTHARATLRRVLARRQLTVSQHDDVRIEATTDLPTLERWLDQAVTAASVAEALE